MGGTTSTQETKVPSYMDEAGKLAVQRMNQIYEMGRMPFTGIDVVGLNPSERAAMENVSSAASAFGMAVPQGDPFAGMQSQTTGGLTGYSSMPIYISDMERLKAERPDQYAEFASMSGFDPITGARTSPVSGGGQSGPAGNPQFKEPTAFAPEGFDTGYTSPELSAGGFDPFGPTDLGNFSIDLGMGLGGEGGGGDSGCVVATHAVNSGAFSPSMKREAVVWCMHNLHGKWWGEAIRRGYRHLGRKKIEQGKAHEHYQEFRNYIDFASGKKRTIKGAIHFAARTVQFFAVGLVKGDA